MDGETNSPVEVPFVSLSADAQAGVVDAFIWREGTDYGEHEVSAEKKRDDIRRQIAKGEVKLVFDAESESVTLVTKREWLSSGAKGSG